MTDPFEPIPSKRTEHFFDLRGEAGDRVMFAPHRVIEDGRVLMVSPAGGLTVGSIYDGATGNMHPTLRADAAFMPVSLLYVFTVDELEAVGKEMIAAAQRIREGAAALADEAIAKAMRGGQ